MERRGHEQARARCTFERGGDVGRVERACRVEGRAAEQRDQHGRFEAVHVLRRHGRHQRHAAQVAPAHLARQALRAGLRVAHQQAPMLGVRHRRAGRAGGQHLGGERVLVDARHGRRRCGVRGRRERLGVVQRRQLQRGRVGIGERVGRRQQRAQPLDRVGRVVRRHQVGLAAQHRRAQADREPVAVGGEIQHRSRSGQARGERLHVGQVLAARQRHAVAPGEGRLEVVGEYQRLRAHHFAALCRYERIASANVARSNSGCSQ